MKMEIKSFIEYMKEVKQISRNTELSYQRAEPAGRAWAKGDSG